MSCTATETKFCTKSTVGLGVLIGVGQPGCVNGLSQEGRSEGISSNQDLLPTFDRFQAGVSAKSPADKPRFLLSIEIHARSAQGKLCHSMPINIFHKLTLSSLIWDK